MAKKIVIGNCAQCPYHSHNGLLQDNPKYICEHKEVFGRGTVKAQYWYNYPIIVDTRTIDSLYNELLDNVEIPDWCPLEDNDGH